MHESSRSFIVWQQTKPISHGYTSQLDETGPMLASTQKANTKHHSPNTMFSHEKSNPFLFWPNFAPILNTNEYREKSTHFKHIEHDLLCECVRFYFRRVLEKKIQ